MHGRGWCGAKERVVWWKEGMRLVEVAEPEGLFSISAENWLYVSSGGKQVGYKTRKCSLSCIMP